MFNISILDIRTASVILQREARSATLPGREGELGVLDFHQEFISTLKRGIIKIDSLKMAIKRGIAKMEGNELVVLVEKP